MDIKVEISEKIIETERLILRAWKMCDAKDMYEYAKVEGVGEMAGWKHHETMEHTLKILEQTIKENSTFAIIHKQDNKVIGSVSINYSWANIDEKYEDKKSKDIGFVLSKTYWGQGIMQEALNSVIDFCFNELAIELITAECFKTNMQSERVLEKLGFEFYKNGEYYAKELHENFEVMRYIRGNI